MQQDQPLERARIDFLILADYAEVVGGKLYLMGGGWDRLGVPNFNLPTQFNVAVASLIPWTAANREHRLRVRLLSEDSQELAPEVLVDFRLARPEGAVEGQTFRATMTARVFWMLPGPGSYVIEASMNDGEPRKTTFHAGRVTPIGTVQ